MLTTTKSKSSPPSSCRFGSQMCSQMFDWNTNSSSSGGVDLCTQRANGSSYFYCFFNVYSFISTSEIGAVEPGRALGDGKRSVSDSVIRQPSISHVSRWY